MPIPKPRSYESQDMFIRRCMADETMNEEFPDRDQRYAVCSQQWRDRDKGGDEVERKDFKLDVKQLGEAGEFEAVIATLNVVDSDDDVILPGAFGEQTVTVLPAHDWSSVPIGKGQTFETGDEARVKGRLNLDTQAGREWYAALKFDMENPPARQEWSFGFFVDKYRIERRDEKDVRVLEKLSVHEVSPVVLGAGVNTRTIDVKERTFGDALDGLIDGLEAMTGRIEHFLKLREGKAQKFTTPQLEKLSTLAGHAEKLVGIVNGLKQPKFDGTDLTPEERALADFVAVSMRV